MPEFEVSVVIVILEPPQRLAATLDSAMQQTLSGVEIIAVVALDLFSGAVKDELLSRKHAVRNVVGQEGISSARLLRLGVEAAKGRYITWLKADDLFDPRKLEWQRHALVESGADWSTCGSWRQDIEEKAGASDSPQSPETIPMLASLLQGTIDPATLLLRRECLENSGGFDETFESLFELDLAVRTAMTGRGAHVTATLMRRIGFRERAPSAHGEARRIVTNVLDLGVRQGIVDSIAKLAVLAAAAPSTTQPVRAARSHLSRLVGRDDLAIAVMSTSADERGLSKLAAELEVPRALTVRPTVEGDAFAVLTDLFARTKTRWVVVVDSGRLPSSDVFLFQLMHSAAESLDACLPVTDPLIYQDDKAEFSVLGTVFRRSALEKLFTPTFHGEEYAFWSAFSRIGKLGALPPSGAVGRPDRTRREGFAAERERQTRLIASLVDDAWYLAANPDLAEIQDGATQHFLTVGWKDRRNPNPWFHTAWYLGRYSDVMQEGINPLEHFVVSGAAAGLRPSPGFDLAWYSKQYLDADNPTAEALLHFMTTGLAMGAVPYPSLSASRTPGDAKVPVSPRNREAASPLGSDLVDELLLALIDGTWYCRTYAPPGVTPSGAAHHYLDKGWRQGFDPNPWFDSTWYLSQNTDARSIDPLTHFVTIGGRLGRRPHPFFDVEWYAAHYLGGVAPSAEVLLHFLTVGLYAGAVTQARLATVSVKNYLLALAPKDRGDSIKTLQNILAHALVEGRLPTQIEGDLSPLLISEDVPAGALPVLLLCGASLAARQRASAAARTLPLQEYGIFVMAGSDETVCISSRLDESGMSISFQIPHQVGQLRTLLLKLRCHRAAVVDVELYNAPITRVIQSANVPVFLNGRERVLPLNTSAYSPR